MNTEIAYDWLQVWVNANHPSCNNCIIDTLDNVCDEMNYVLVIDQPKMNHLFQNGTKT